jgi:hypothetical protein
MPETTKPAQSGGCLRWAVSDLNRGPPACKGSLHIDKRIRLYKNVTSVPELLARTERTQPPLYGVEMPETPLDALAATDDLNGPKVFVLMPFGPDWSKAVYNAIESGCLRAGASEVQRADAITETGLIAAQILRAIEGADLLVADLTAANGNVMYEVGCADALEKTVVLVNQQIDAAPFDIRGHRQIAYAPYGLPQLADDVAAFVATALGDRAAFDRPGPPEPRDRVEALRDAYSRGRILRESLPGREGRQLVGWASALVDPAQDAGPIQDGDLPAERGELLAQVLGELVGRGLPPVERAHDTETHRVPEGPEPCRHDLRPELVKIRPGSGGVPLRR